MASSDLREAFHPHLQGSRRPCHHREQAEQTVGRVPKYVTAPPHLQPTRAATWKPPTNILK